MNTSQRITLFIGILAAAATILAAVLGNQPTGSSDFTTDMRGNEANCYEICASKGAACIGARRKNDEPVGCDYRGVNTGQAFVNRAKSCLCRKV